MKNEIDLKEGDWWVFHTNNGSIRRQITTIGDKLIGYTCNGIARVCKKTTFNRWKKGASLEYRKCESI